MSTNQAPFKGTAKQAKELDAWLKKNREMPGVALSALQKAQEIYGYVPREVQQTIADAIGKPLSEIYGISTFYSQFDLEPKGRNRISVCLGTACYIKGSGRIYQISNAAFKRLTAEDAPMVNVPQWLQREKNALKGTVVKLPAREDIDMPIEEHLIVELYSK